MQYYVIGDEDTVLGFGMVGLRGRVVNSPTEAEYALEEAIGEQDIGIIIITERIAELIRSQVDNFIFTHAFPLILEVPDRMGRMTGKPKLREMVNRAIGIKL